jgi:hypothetical protein
MAKSKMPMGGMGMGKKMPMGKMPGGATTKPMPTQDSPMYKGNKTTRKKPSGVPGGNGSGMSYN